jgi:phospholipid/cholesterol/gamma-HCH transport system permease protein
LKSAVDTWDKILVKPVEWIGRPVVKTVEEIGRFILFMIESFQELVKPPHRPILILQQMEFIGNQSFVIILMSAFAIGAVFALQVGMVFKTFSAEGQMGIATATALSRELAPMMTAFLITGRAGSAITAEIATMRVNEQVDAMESMGVSPVNYLVVPRLIANVIMMPLLSGIFVLVGVFGSFVVGTLVFNVDQGLFFFKITDRLVTRDISMGLEKALLFSVIIALISCQFGLRAGGGAKGVGRATTNSVITTLLVVLLLDFIYTFFQIVL